MWLEAQMGLDVLHTPGPYQIRMAKSGLDESQMARYNKETIRDRANSQQVCPTADNKTNKTNITQCRSVRRQTLLFISL